MKKEALWQGWLLSGQHEDNHLPLYKWPVLHMHITLRLKMSKKIFDSDILGS